MNIQEFLNRCEDSFGSKVKLMPQRQAIYIEKLRRFSNDQLTGIYDKVLETTGRFPEIKDIYSAARELGYLQTESEQFKPHRWQKSDCRMCKGEGRLCITWILTSEIKNDRLVEIHALSRIIPYSESCNSEHIKLRDGEFRSLFRCACLDGDRETLPKSWPKWSRSAEAVRYL